MLLAVLSKLKIDLSQTDVYTASVGGAKLTEPGVDLAAALAVVSAHAGLALPAGLVAVGEVGLAGEVRPVANVEARVREAARIGFTFAIVPRGVEDLTVTGMRLVAVPDLQTAVSYALG